MMQDVTSVQFNLSLLKMIFQLIFIWHYDTISVMNAFLFFCAYLYIQQYCTECRINLTFSSPIQFVAWWKVKKNKLLKKKWKTISSFSVVIYTVSQKKLQNCFCHNVVKFPPTLIIFGTLIAHAWQVYVTCTYFPPHLIGVNALPC